MTGMNVIGINYESQRVGVHYRRNLSSLAPLSKKMMETLQRTASILGLEEGCNQVLTWNST